MQPQDVWAVSRNCIAPWRHLNFRKPREKPVLTAANIAARLAARGRGEGLDVGYVKPKGRLNCTNARSLLILAGVSKAQSWPQRPGLCHLEREQLPYLYCLTATRPRCMLCELTLFTLLCSSKLLLRVCGCREPTKLWPWMAFAWTASAKMSWCCCGMAAVQTFLCGCPHWQFGGERVRPF